MVVSRPLARVARNGNEPNFDVNDDDGIIIGPGDISDVYGAIGTIGAVPADGPGRINAIMHNGNLTFHTFELDPSPSAEETMLALGHKNFCVLQLNIVGPSTDGEDRDLQSHFIGFAFHPHHGWICLPTERGSNYFRCTLPTLVGLLTTRIGRSKLCQFIAGAWIGHTVR